MYLIVYCCYVAIPPPPNPPTVSEKDPTSVIVEIDVPPTNVTVTIICSIKYKKKGDPKWLEVQVPDCQSVIIHHLQQGSTYIFKVVLKYKGQTTGSESKPKEIHIKDRKCFIKLLNAL